MKLAGVVVLYEPGDCVLNNINSYIDSLETLYIVDNSSSNNSKKFKGKKIRYIYNKGNLGIAEALNIGAKRAIKDGYKWLLTMDQDSCFDKYSIGKMVVFLGKLKDDDVVKNILNTTIEKIGYRFTN